MYNDDVENLCKRLHDLHHGHDFSFLSNIFGKCVRLVLHGNPPQNWVQLMSIFKYLLRIFLCTKIRQANFLQITDEKKVQILANNIMRESRYFRKDKAFFTRLSFDIWSEKKIWWYFVKSLLKLLFKYVITYLYRKWTGFLIRHQILHISPQGKWDFVKVNKKIMKKMFTKIQKLFFCKSLFVKFTLCKMEMHPKLVH